MTHVESLRLSRGLTRKAAAEEMGVPYSTLRHVERGGKPHGPTAKKIADFYEKPVTELWPIEEMAA